MKKFGYIAILSFFSLIPFCSLSAQSVDLIWQGQTYTPPFYDGRALWSNQSFVTVMAIPQGLGNPQGLIYRWVKDGTVLGNITGVGRNSIMFEDTIFSKPQRVQVEIIDVEENILATSSVVLTPIKAELLIYEDNPLYGYIFNQEIGGSFSLSEDEISFSAFPLFTTPVAREGNGLSYRWTSGSSAPETSHTVTYRIPEEGAGSAYVSLRFENTSKILFPLTREFLIEFGE